MREEGIFMLTVIGALFLLGITFISYQQIAISFVVFLGLLAFILFSKENRFTISVLLSFLVGLAFFMFANNFIEPMTISKELKILLNRIFLIFIIIGLIIPILFFRKKVTWYNRKPEWNNPISLLSFKIDTFLFWLVGIIVNGAIYLIFILQKDIEYILSLLLFCLFFSLINAVLEEVIWRGIVLSALKDSTSVIFASIITSIGFGLLHLSIGFSMPLSLLISAAGLIYALITLKTKSIYPSIVMHIVINIGMVFSGFIV